MTPSPSTALSCHALNCHREQWIELTPSHVVDVNLQFAAGELCGVCGPDGSGKGLLLNVLGLLESPDSGEIVVNGVPSHTLSAEEACEFRNETFGFLFNHPCLLPSFSVAENVAMPLFRICGGDAAEARDRTMDVLEFCGIAPLETTLAGRLDSADRTRVALARALVHQPSILVAISPRADDILLQLAKEAAKRLGLIVLWAGPVETLEGYAHRILEMDAGQISRDFRP